MINEIYSSLNEYKLKIDELSRELRQMPQIDDNLEDAISSLQLSSNELSNYLQANWGSAKSLHNKSTQQVTKIAPQVTPKSKYSLSLNSNEISEDNDPILATLWLLELEFLDQKIHFFAKHGSHVSDEYLKSRLPKPDFATRFENPCLQVRALKAAMGAVFQKMGVMNEFSKGASNLREWICDHAQAIDTGFHLRKFCECQEMKSVEDAAVIEGEEIRGCKDCEVCGMCKKWKECENCENCDKYVKFEGVSRSKIVVRWSDSAQQYIPITHYPAGEFWNDARKCYDTIESDVLDAPL